MKELTILLGVNGWEYSVVVNITYESHYEAIMSDTKDPCRDSEGNPTPNKLILDGRNTINFGRRGLEILQQVID